MTKLGGAAQCIGVDEALHDRASYAATLAQLVSDRTKRGANEAGLPVSNGVPDGWHSLTPRIVATDASGLVRFLRAVFDATGELRTDAPSQMRIGDSYVMVSDDRARPPFPAFLYVYVKDADATYQRALEAGGVSLEGVRDTPYGDRRGMVQDPFGNVWQIATYKPTVPPR